MTKNHFNQQDFFNSVYYYLHDICERSLDFFPSLQVVAVNEVVDKTAGTTGKFYRHKEYILTKERKLSDALHAKAKTFVKKWNRTHEDDQKSVEEYFDELKKSENWHPKPFKQISILGLRTMFKKSTCDYTKYGVNVIADLYRAAKRALKLATEAFRRLLTHFADHEIDTVAMKCVFTRIPRAGLQEQAFSLQLNNKRVMDALRSSMASQSLHSFMQSLPVLLVPSHTFRSFKQDQVFLLRGTTEEESTLPTEISPCVPLVTSVCSGPADVEAPEGTVYHGFFLGATLERFQSWGPMQHMRSSQREYLLREDRVLWGRLMRNLKILEEEELKSIFGEDFKKVPKYEELPPEQREEIAQFRNMIYQNLDSLDAQQKQTLGKVPLRDGPETHTAIAFAESGDGTYTLRVLQACFSCKLSSRQKEAIDLQPEDLMPLFRQFDTLARQTNPTSCAEVAMTQFCKMFADFQG
ncbi:hypothetical protein K4K51_007460 [Colletotrichum sp. SAR 10_75]|nr:hypothetical protein K4K51_007460 [Colletotrichum sp. SAR 10_75]